MIGLPLVLPTLLCLPVARQSSLTLADGYVHALLLFRWFEVPNVYTLDRCFVTGGGI